MGSNRADRERELIALMLFDKAGLAAIYRRVLGLPLRQPVHGVRDREMIRQIVNIEFPHDCRDLHHDHAPHEHAPLAWANTASPNAATR